ncbi:hypothetical protein MMC17_006841 [Xylographa soralifera]|nr:hypothetical protein [Xylographa soralifera]
MPESLLPTLDIKAALGKKQLRTERYLQTEFLNKADEVSQATSILRLYSIDSRLLLQLTKIRGKVGLRIQGSSLQTELEVPEELQILCGTLKSLLALPKEIKPVSRQVLHIENGKQDIVQKVLGASKRYSDLVQQIEAEEKQLKDWEALQGQIEAVKERVRNLTAEKQAIEKGLRDLQELAAGLPVHSS